MQQQKVDNSLKIEMEVCQQEANFIEFYRDIKFGKITVIIADGVPRMVEQGMKQVRFDLTIKD